MAECARTVALSRTFRRPLNAPHHRLVPSRSARRSPWRRIAVPLAAFALLAGARTAAAQTVLGYGDDATTLPAGTIRIGFTNLWSRWYQEYDAPSGASIDTRSQIRRTLLAIDLGITDRLMLTGMIPSVGANEVATFFPDSARAIHADSLNSYDRSAIGDARVTLKLVWLGQQSEHDRLAAAGLHVRSALAATAQFGTGALPRAGSQFGLGSGEATNAIEVASFWDIVAGRHFWTSIVGRYEHHLADTRDVRVGAGTPGDPFDATAAPVLTTRTLGNAVALAVTPRFTLGEYFSLGAEYQYVHEAAGTFTGTRDVTDSTGAVVHLDASALDATSAYTEQWVGGGIVFSSLAASERGHGAYPFDIQLRYRRAIGLSNGQPPRGEWGVGLRFYWQLWGRDIVGRDAPAAQRAPREP